ncbi:MAG: xanthine dehydrogenase family protein molybdopterin-binding subunit [Myxococcales bacterium]|nr:xanthine dehydrogenase family protein molybdopterin-binding subunit [Myxococcales bacterium]
MGITTGGLGLALFADEAAALDNTVATVKATFDPSVFLHVDASGEVTVVCHRSEMGQGVRSSYVHMYADELGADPRKVKLVQADGDVAYGDQNTDGSTSVRRRFEEYRRIAATAREALVAVAAKRLRVKAGDLVARDGVVRHEPSGRSLGFGELAEEAAEGRLPDPKKVSLRSKTDLRYIGKTQPLLDAPLFVTGQATYAADVQLPGLLVAVVARPPVVGARVERYDGEAAKKIPGVKAVVEIPAPLAPWGFKVWGGVAVLADNTWAALRGREALAITWSGSSNDGYDSSAFRTKLEAAVAEPGEVRRSRGDAPDALAKASKTVEATYYVPHLPHLPMEPPCATARLIDGKLEVWACTQNPQTAQKSAAEATGMDPKDVVAHVTFLGGAFGRKSKGDFIAEAAYLTKQVGAPVRVQWTRTDDIRHGYYNSVNAQKLVAGLDDENRVTAWLHRTAFPPISATFDGRTDLPSEGDLQQGVLDVALAVPHVRAEACRAPAHVRIGWLRSVYNIFHGFGVGSFVDEIANAKGQDPADCWLELIGAPRQMSLSDLGVGDLKNYGHSLDEHPVDAGRLRGVVERVRQLSDWDRQRKAGRALGIAAHRSFVAYVAVVVALQKRPDGKLHVDEAWVALDAGTVLNPDRARSQMEGAVIFGLNLALFGGVTFAKGRAQQTNFHDLRLLRMGDAPRAIHVALVDSDAPPSGVGEPGLPPVAPAIANAYFALTGKRQRELPMARAFGYDR